MLIKGAYSNRNISIHPASINNRFYQRLISNLLPPILPDSASSIPGSDTSCVCMENKGGGGGDSWLDGLDSRTRQSINMLTLFVKVKCGRPPYDAIFQKPVYPFAFQTSRMYCPVGERSYLVVRLRVQEEPGNEVATSQSLL